MLCIAIAGMLLVSQTRIEVDPDDALKRMQSLDQLRSADLHGYTSRRHYRLENTRFHKIAEMTVSVEYRRGIKSFQIESESGQEIIREKVLHRMLQAETEAAEEAVQRRTALTPQNYEFRFAGLGSDRGRTSYLFDIAPRGVNKFMVHGRVWLDAVDFAITRLEGRPAKNPSIWIRNTRFVHAYERQGRFWL